MSAPAKLSGLFAVRKPPGVTSADVVNILKKVINAGRKKGERTKIGHGGTLDKEAEGVLVIGVGSGTKLLGNFLKCEKSYTCAGVLGTETDTGDATGEVVKTAPYDHVTADRIRACLPKFTGKIMQLPPTYSALKHKGQRFSDLARAGELGDVRPEPREVVVTFLGLTADDDLPRFGLVINCGGGFYVRSLVRDLGTELGTAAHMTGLLRTRQGDFSIMDPYTLPQSKWTLEHVEAAVQSWNARRTEHQ